MRWRSLLPAALLLAAAAALAQTTMVAPILNFRLPIFNKQGFRAWELRGGSGRYVDKNQVELTNVRLQVFSGDERGVLDLEISSPFAVARPEDRVVSGPGQLQVVGRGFEMFGDDWLYEDAKKTIVIRQNVVVSFADNIGNLLR